MFLYDKTRNVHVQPNIQAGSWILVAMEKK